MYIHVLTAAVVASLLGTLAERPADQSAEHLFSFEKTVNWKRGTQPNGTLTLATEQYHDGGASARLDYQLPGVPNNNFVVFTTRKVLKGQPNAISAWVYGDGSNHFLNVWIQDSQKEMRMFTFGRISHNGWRNMVALFDTSKPWPNVHISGPDNGVLDYPVAFAGIVLDNPGVVSSGRIYVDEFKAVSGASAPPATVAVQPAAPQPVPTLPAPAPAAPACAGPPRIDGFSASATTVELGQSITLRWGAVSNASRAEIDNGIGGVATPGEISVRPTRSTIYRLTATGCGGAVVYDLPVTVTAQYALRVTGRVFVRDDDLFNPDEVGDFVLNEDVYVSSSGQDTDWIWQRCVDEVRAEIRLRLRYNTNGTIRAFGDLLIFEGTSCTDGNLEGIQHIDVVITPSQPIQQNINLRSSGNDEARFTLEFSYQASAPLP